MDYTRCTLTAASGEPIATIPLARGETLYDAIERSGVVAIRTTCRGSTICGLCRVTVEEGAAALDPPMADERELLGEGAPANVRLACRVTLPAALRRLVASTPYWEKG
jgi:ferredoxin